MAWQMRLDVMSPPIAQPRHRAAITKAPRAKGNHGNALGKHGGAKRITHYIPGKHPIHGYKNDIAVAVHKAISRGRNLPPMPCIAQLEMIFLFVMPRPDWDTRPGRRWMAKTPDIDNMMKSVMDALNGVLYVDDAQVVATTAMKFHAGPSEAPHLELIVRPVCPVEDMLDWVMKAG